MLAGRRPYEVNSKSVGEAIRVICEVPPKALKSVWQGTRKLDADLATIVAKALEKKPGDRYDSAGAIRDDIERFRSDQPILARPPSTAYQLRKLISRNRLASSFIAAIATMLVVFGVLMSVLWRQSEAARTRAEATVMVSRGRAELERSPSTALAYAVASLEISDSDEARRLVLEVLARGPTATVIAPTPGHGPAFSLDGRLLTMNRLNLATHRGEQATWETSGGPVRWTTPLQGRVMFNSFDPAGSKILLLLQGETKVRSIGLQSMNQAPPFELGPDSDPMATPDARKLIVFSPSGEGGTQTLIRIFEVETLELLESGVIDGAIYAESADTHNSWVGVDHDGSRLGYAHADKVYVLSLEDLTLEPELIGHHLGAGMVHFHPDQTTLISGNSGNGEILFWKLPGFNEKPLRRLQYRNFSAPPRFDATGRFLAAGTQDGETWFWDLAAPAGALPISLKKETQAQVHDVLFHPRQPLLVAADNGGIVMWHLDRQIPVRLGGHTTPARGLAFDPKGEWLISSSDLELEMFVWPLEGGQASVNLEVLARTLKVHPDGERLIVGGEFGAAVVGFDEGFSPVSPQGIALTDFGVEDVRGVAFSPDGRWAATGGGGSLSEHALVRLWDLETGATSVLDPQDKIPQIDVLFLRDGRLAASGSNGVRLWTPSEGTFVTLSEEPAGFLAATPDDRNLLWISGAAINAESGGKLRVFDLEAESYQDLASHGDQIRAIAVSPDGAFVATGSLDGAVRYGPITGEEPHLLLGHRGAITAVAVDPLGRWIASAGFDLEIRLWPVPTGVPTHLLPKAEVLDLLHGLTNYRVIEDASVPGGFRIEVGEFPGWEAGGN